MKKTHWALLVVVVGLVVGSLWFSGDSDQVATCHSCECAVGCCDAGTCDHAECDCSCKD